MIKKRKKVSFFTVLRKKRISTVAGSWVFYLTLALIPLAVLLFTAFNLFDISVGDKFLPYLPDELKNTGEEIFALASNNAKSLTIFFVVSVLVSGSALLNQMSKDGDFIYGTKTLGRGFFRRIKALFALFVLFSVFLFSAFLVAFGDALFNKIKNGTLSFVFAKISIPLIIISISFLIIVLLNKFICPIRLEIKNLLLGSLVSLIIIVVGTIGFSLYMKFFRTNNAVSLGIVSVLAFLSWLYILMLGLLIGTSVIVTISKNKKFG